MKKNNPKFIKLLITLISLFIFIKIHATNNKDTLSTHKAFYKKAKYFKKNFQLDSAYYYLYKSYLISKEIPDSLYITRALYQLAIIDYYNNDNNSCEHNLIQAITHIPLKYKYKYSLFCYNLMGLNLKKKSNYKDAIIYFEKYRSTYLNRKDTLYHFLSFSNNMGQVYQKSKKYVKSINYYNRIVEIPQLEKSFPIEYARAIDNKAWSLFKVNKEKKALPLFIKAKLIREKAKDQPGLVMSYFHLSKYYNFIHKSKKAKENILQSIQIAESIGDIEGKLKALYFLSEIDPKNSPTYFKQHKIIKDSLLEKERFFKHQTARIRFETAEKDHEITQQKTEIKSKNRTIYLIAFSMFILAISSLVFFFQKKKIAKQKENIQELQKEVHHTAKNNLKLALVFISKIRNKPSVENFIGLDNRIKSMLVLHEQLYKKTSNGKVDMQQYIQNICQSLHLAYSDSSKNITYDLEITQDVPYKKAVRLGLIINELVTNIYKYAFAGKEQGNYRIEIKESNKKILILITDNGIGFPEGFDKDKLTSYGLNMVSGLVKQINGTIAFKREKGNTKIYIFV